MVTTSTAAPPAGRTGRVAFWDNARFACIALVVVGHAIQRMTADSDAALTVYLAIYTFHMPALAIISGRFSSSQPPGRTHRMRVLTELVLPYLLLEGLWSLVQFLENGARFNPTTPSWTLWFLLALAVFRLVLPYLALTRFPLTIAVVLSVGVGYFGNVDTTFSLSRILGILPFFVLGWKLRESPRLTAWTRGELPVLWPRMLALAVLAAGVAVLAIGLSAWRELDLYQWFFYRDSYRELGEPAWWAGLIRLGSLLVGVVMSAAFLALVPRRRTALTGLGAGTMYVYLLHSFVLFPLRESGLLSGLEPDWLWLPLLVAGSVLVAGLLATGPVRRLFRPLIEPRAAWLFRRSEPPSPEAGAETSLPRVSERLEAGARGS